MRSERAVAVLLAQLITLAVFAQDASTPSVSEFGRGSGGQIDVLTKHARRLSGSLGMSLAGSHGYEATFGGTLAEDRIWFFGSVLRDDTLRFAAPRTISSAPVETSAALGKIDAQLGDRNSLAALYSAGKSQPTAFGAQLPSTFLSMNYTGIVSSNLFFTASYSRSNISDRQSTIGLEP